MHPSVNLQTAHDHVESAPTITWNERPRSAECAIWNFAIRYAASQPLRAALASAFESLAKAFLSEDTGDNWLTGEVPWGRKIDLVLDWCEATGDGRFANIALEMARGGDAFLSAWQDGQTLAGLVQSLHDGSHRFSPRAEEIREALVARLIDILETDLDSDDLIAIGNEIDRNTAPDALNAALTAAIKVEFDNLNRKVEGMSSESSLSDHMNSLRTLASGAGIPTDLVRQAERLVERRIERLEEEEQEPDEPPSVQQAATRPQAFGDEELNTLFSSLLSR
jgi:hypothetical protein